VKLADIKDYSLLFIKIEIPEKSGVGLEDPSHCHCNISLRPMQLVRQ
jgi:hypothetical protein